MSDITLNVIPFDSAFFLTEEEANSLKGKEYRPNCYFNPVQDSEDRWCIFYQESQDCLSEEFVWVKDLSYGEFLAKPTPNPFI
jgi:hypothetical protein